MDKSKKTPSPRRITQHPVAFPEYKSVKVTRENVVEKILSQLKNHQTRELRIAYDNYGLEVSANYKDGQFVSMIQKGSGNEGELFEAEVALKLVPKEIEYKEGNVTAHLLLSLKWDSRLVNPEFSKHEVPTLIRKALRRGECIINDKEITCRSLRVYVDKVAYHADDVSSIIGNAFVAHYLLPVEFGNIAETALDMVAEVGIHCAHPYGLPARGLVVMDESLNAADEAFKTTYFIFDFPDHDN